MNEQELNQYALDVAENRLRREFDAEAFIVRDIAIKNLAKMDKVPESNIDEQIDDIGRYFIQYMKTKSVDDLSVMLLHT